MIYRTCQICGRELEPTDENFWIKNNSSRNLINKLGHVCKDCDNVTLFECHGCGKELPRDENYFDSIGNSMRSTCRRCRTNRSKERQAAANKGNRVCDKCLQSLSCSSFEGTRKTCIRCRNQRRASENSAKRLNADDSWQKPDEFSDCTKCGEKKPITSTYFEPRPEVECGFRSQCRDCLYPRKAGYVRKCRAKRRKELGVEEYNRRKSKVHKKWYHKNKEHMKEWRKTSVATHYNNWKRYKIWMSLDEYKELVAFKSCFFCGYDDFGEHINGMCRIDQSQDVSIENRDNYVVACAICNGSKGTLDPITFVDRCKIVNDDLHHSQTEWPVNNPSSYAMYASRSIRMGFGEIGITEAEFRMYQLDVCHYCERRPQNGCGLDRKQNDSIYIVDNVVSCCGECNYLKKAQDYDDFFVHCERVSDYCDLSQLPVSIEDIMRCYAHVRQG